jgi:hypothetical protein
MRINRRTLLISGGASAVILGGGAAAAWWPGTASATAPWRATGESLGDARLDALAFAILAPNPHNRQPWQYRLDGADRIDVYCDLDRRLPATDPFDRQICIGFGCMIELFVLAAAARGYAANVALWPDGAPQPRLDTRRVAALTLTRSGPVRPDPLAEAILVRRSNKTVYDNTPVPAAMLAALVGDPGVDGLRVAGSVDPADVEKLRQLTWAAWMAEYETAATRRETIDLMRIGNGEIVANPDGVELGGVMMGLGKFSGLVTRETLDTPGSTAYQQGIDMYEPMLRSAQGHVWIVTDDSGRAAQIAAGRRWVRMNLRAQNLGLALHPLSQCLQEFPEMAAHYADVHRTLGAADGAIVQMLGRIGFAPPPPPTPRWPLKTHLVAA